MPSRKKGVPGFETIITGTPGNVLGAVERLSANIAGAAKKASPLDGPTFDPSSSLALTRRIREQIVELGHLVSDLAELEKDLEANASHHYLQLEALIRDECESRGWKIDGEWPVYHIERGPCIEILVDQRAIVVAGKRLPGSSIQSIFGALQPLVADLVPKGFSARGFAADFAAAYDARAGRHRRFPYSMSTGHSSWANRVSDSGAMRGRTDLQAYRSTSSRRG